jgi:hypothetical protein
MLFRGRGTQLTAGQRYHFVAGWLPWLADGLNLVMNCAALVWTLVLVTFPQHIEPPLMMFSVLPVSLFVFKLVKLLHLYRSRVGATFVQTIAAAIAGLSLSHTIGTAMVSGLFRKDKPFFRTPKRARKHALGAAFAAAREEFFMMIGLWVAAIAASQIPNIDGDDLTLIASPDLNLWVAVLLIQSIPYAAAVIVSFVNVLNISGRWIGEAGVRQPAREPRAAAASQAALASPVLPSPVLAATADLKAVEARE